MEETWKDIIDYEGLYQISNLGRVKSLLKRDGFGLPKKQNKVLKGFKSKGYIKARLCKDLVEKDFLIHRLVLNHFLPCNNKTLQVNHINGIKSDNKLSNLEWCSGSENVKHAFKTGLKKPQKGITNGQSKLKEDDILEIKKLLKENKTLKVIGEKFNVHLSLISLIKNNKIWEHIQL